MCDSPAPEGFVDPSGDFLKGKFICSLPPFHVGQAFQVRDKM
jgi:hypothetical protein